MKENNIRKINRREFVSTIGVIGVATTLAPVSSFAEDSFSLPASGNIMKCQHHLFFHGGNHEVRGQYCREFTAIIDIKATDKFLSVKMVDDTGQTVGALNI